MTEKTLRDLARSQGLDFATALLFDRLVSSPEHGPFIEQVARLPVRRPSAFAAQADTVAVMPGAFYREDSTSGADGRLVLEAIRDLGYRGEVIPARSFGRLAENAAILLAWLRARAGQRVVLVSLSKGGAEVRLGLAAPEAAEAFRDVLAWISLSGLFYGTPLVSWLHRRPWRMAVLRLLFWLRGYDIQALAELERGPGRSLDGAVTVPPHLRVIHVVGFPLARHLSCPLARRGHRRTGRLGPNDGGPILLADLRLLPGHIYPVWGADHYLRPAGDVRPLVTRLLEYVTRHATRDNGRHP